jgi:hypothetical protein
MFYLTVDFRDWYRCGHARKKKLEIRNPIRIPPRNIRGLFPLLLTR